MAFRDRRWLPLGVIILVATLSMLPIWWYGLPLNAHDTRAHANWQVFFSTQLWSGEVYPRWLAGANEGFGSPSFYIYPPLSQYVAALLAPLSDSAAWVYQRLGIAASAACLISGVGAYLWLLEVTRDRVSALAGALVFLLAPYHLLTDTYVRAAYAELWAFAWAPFSLLALHLLRKNLNAALLLYTGATAALFLSHAPSCIALLPAYIAYAALLSLIYKQKRIFLWSVVATFLALLISGAYLGTALTHQQYINSASLFSGYNDFFRWFVVSNTRWPTPATELIITGTTLVQCGAAAVFGVMAIQQSMPGSPFRRLAWFCVLISFAILFLVSGFSKPLWEMIPVIQKIQFPWRLLTTQTVFLALTCALYVHALRSYPVGPRTRLLQGLMTAFIFALVAVNAGLIFYAKPTFIHAAPLPVRDAPEYQLGSIKDAKLLFEGSETARLLAGQGQVSMKLMGPRHLRIHTDAKTDITFIVHHFYYPEWRCTTLGGKGDCQVRKFDTHMPLITVSTGPGKRQLELQLSSPAERRGYLASLIGLVLLISLCVLNHFVGRRPQRDGGGTGRGHGNTPGLP